MRCVTLVLVAACLAFTACGSSESPTILNTRRLGERPHHPLPVPESSPRSGRRRRSPCSSCRTRWSRRHTPAGPGDTECGRRGRSPAVRPSSRSSAGAPPGTGFDGCASCSPDARTAGKAGRGERAHASGQRRGAGAPFALALSARSNVLQEFAGGPGQIAMHGVANIGGTLGTAASHGCVRLGGRSIRWLAARIAPGVPVTITP